jgi:hypothetical protein
MIAEPKDAKSRADPLDDISDFASAPAKSKPPAAAVRKVSEANGFTGNRAPAPAKQPVQRRHRTGRNVQLNIKASRATIDAFIALSEAEGWVLGETLDHLLQNWKASK